MMVYPNHSLTSSSYEHTSEEWADHQDLLIRLYIVENKRLKEVKEIMVHDLNFYATCYTTHHLFVDAMLKCIQQ